MTRSTILLTVLVAGCNRPAPPTFDSSASAAEATPAIQPIAATPTPTGAGQPTPAASTEFAYPPDLAGKQLPQVVAPKVPPLPQTEKFGQTPLARTPSVKLLDPDPLTRTVFVPTPVSLPRPAGVKPTSPAERVPPDIGFGADAVPAKTVFAVGPGITAKVRDLNLPPDLPILGRPVPDRASLEDPTADTSNAAIVTNSKIPTLLPSAFQRMGLPDPFELADQVKPRVPPNTEPLVVPVTVNPARPK
jgi:hypothetical protein